MAAVTTALVGLNSQCLAPGPVGAAAADQVLIVNLDTANTVRLGSASTNLIYPLGPLASVTLTAPVFAAAATVPLEVGIAPGGSSYSPGSLTITGPVTAEITGTVTAEIEGTTDVSVQNATIDVVGSGGFVLPGQLALLFKSAATVSAGPGANTSIGTFAVDTFSSVVFAVNGPVNSSTANGAAICATWQFEWQDTAGNIIGFSDAVSHLVSTFQTVQIPVKGSRVTVRLYNWGTTGTLSVPSGDVFLWGDFRALSATTVLSYGINASPTINIAGWTFLPPTSPVLTVQQWLANVNQTAAGLAASTQYLIPLPMWNGPVSGWYQQVTNALANDATIVDLTYALQGSIPPGTGYLNGILANLPSAIQSSPVPVSYPSPPTQLALLFKTGTTVGSTFLTLTGD